MNHYVCTLLNVVLRTGTLATRFALVFILAKHLSAESLGYYGLFTATVGYALLCVGLDLYIYTTREISKIDSDRQGLLLKSQSVIVVIIYLFLSPILLILLPKLGLPHYLSWWILPILLLEHINQELYRLLIILSNQLSASFLLFIRQGSWAIAAAALMTFNEGARDLNVVMFLWACAGVTAAAAGVWKVHSLGLGGWRQRTDWSWIRKGIAVSGTFLVATLSVRAVQTVDRYWLQDLAGIEVVGAYALFFGVASALGVFLDAAIFSFRYPELVTLSNEQKYEEMRGKVWQMTWQVIAASAAFALASSLLLPVLLNWIGKSIYLAEVSLYYWVLAAMIAYSLSMIPHYALYARGRDRAIVTSHVMALLAFGVATLALIPISRFYAVPFGVLVAMSMVLVWKSAAYLMAFRHDARRGKPPNIGAI